MESERMPDKHQKQRILLTAAFDDVEHIVANAGEPDPRWMHLPLEKYRGIMDGEIADDLAGKLETAETIVCGHKRNARFLIRKAESLGLSDLVKNRVNLASDRRTAEYLEERGVPAIYPGSEKPVKMLEFILRLRRFGPVFYPCGDHTREEIPGLLKELDIEVTEQVLYRLEGPSEDELASYRLQIIENHCDVVVYHSRRAVNRTEAAFPQLNIVRPVIVAGDKGVADKLAKSDIDADIIAEGSWNSILEHLEKV